PLPALQGIDRDRAPHRVRPLLRRRDEGASEARGRRPRGDRGRVDPRDPARAPPRALRLHGLRQVPAGRGATGAILAGDVMPPLAAAAFAAGLLGGVHCAGMCGGIVGTLALQARGPAWGRQLAYNAGRIFAYVAAGTAAGLAGGIAAGGGAWLEARMALFLLANVAMIFLGLYVAGWSRVVLAVEAAGRPVWRRIEPIARRMLPIDSTAKALGAGL